MGYAESEVQANGRPVGVALQETLPHHASGRRPTNEVSAVPDAVAVIIYLHRWRGALRRVLH